MKKVKHYIPLIITLCFIALFVTINIAFYGYEDSDIECINSSFAYEKTLFKLEDDEHELIYFQSKYTGHINKCELKKKKIFGDLKYKITSLDTSSPHYLDKKWIDFNDNIKYIALEYKNDIEYIDCEGYKPVGYEISWVRDNGEKASCWIYVIDKTTQNVDN